MAKDLEDVDYFFLGFEPSSLFLINMGVERELKPVRSGYFSPRYSVRVYK